MKTKRVDQTELKVMQSFVMLILAIGFVLNSWEVVASQMIIFGLTIISPMLNPFIGLYRSILRPLHIIEADWRVDNMAAHRFASMIGLALSTASVGLLTSGHELLGWSLIGLILVFGVLALRGWCAGCYSYYMINRLGAKGFFKHTPIGTQFPGARPPKGA